MAQHLSGPPSLAGQVVLITGGSGGMGRAVANTFKAAGATVIATDLSEHEDIGPGIEYRSVQRYVARRYGSESLTACWLDTARSIFWCCVRV